MALAANPPLSMARQIPGQTDVDIRVPIPSRGTAPIARGPLSGLIARR